MGKKIASLYAVLVTFAIMLEILGCSMRWHASRWMVGPMTVFLLHTNFLHVKMDKGSNFLCNVVSKDLCEELEDGIMLHEAQQHWCAPLVYNLYSGPCYAFNWAYILGMIGICALVINIILLCASTYTLYLYMESPKHKPHYRRTAMIVTIIATVLLVSAFMAHNLQAVRLLDEMGSAAMLGGLLGASMGSGASYGCFVAWSGVLCQTVAASLFSCMALGDEPTEDEMAQEKIFKEEARMHQALEKSPYGAQDQASVPAGSYAGQGYGSHAYGAGYVAQASPGYAIQGYGTQGFDYQASQAQQLQFGQAAW